MVSRLRDANAKFLFLFLSKTHDGYDSLIHELSKYKEFCWTPSVVIDYVPDGHYGDASHNLIAMKLHDRWMKLYAEN